MVEPGRDRYNAPPRGNRGTAPAINNLAGTVPVLCVSERGVAQLRQGFALLLVMRLHLDIGLVKDGQGNR
jgi:hypothetical protein